MTTISAKQNLTSLATLDLTRINSPQRLWTFFVAPTRTSNYYEMVVIDNVMTLNCEKVSDKEREYIVNMKVRETQLLNCAVCFGVIVIVSLGLGVTPANAAIQLITNGGFNSNGSPSGQGWKATSNVGFLSQHWGVTPNSTPGMAVLPVNAIGNATLAQTFTVPKTVTGMATFSFDYRLKALNVSPIKAFGVDALLVGANGKTIFQQAIIDPLWGKPYTTDTGWQTYSISVPASLIAGQTYTLTFRNQNLSNPGQFFTAYINNVSVTANVPTNVTPEPASMAIWGLFGLIGIVAGRRARRVWPAT